MPPGPDPPTPEGSRLAKVNAAFWGGLSRLRGARIVHSQGLAYRGTFVAQPHSERVGANLFDEPGTYRAIVRFSRSIGLPPPLPDLLGMAVRIEDAHGSGRHQDFPMISSAKGRVARHLLLPAVAGFFGQPYSTSLPYAIGSETWVVGAMADSPRGDRGARGQLRELEDARGRDRLRFTLAIARLSGSWRPVGALHFGEGLSAHQSEELKFNPWNCGGAIQPTGPFMGSRLSAYRGSQAGRERARRRPGS